VTATSVASGKPLWKRKPKPEPTKMWNGEPIKLRLVQQIIWSAVALHIAVWAISALYFIITQVKYPIGHLHDVLPFIPQGEYLWFKPIWDTLPEHFYPLHWMSADVWDLYRHVGIRGLEEGVWAGLIVRTLVIKHKEREKVTFVDKVMLTLRYPNHHQGYRTNAWQIMYAVVAIVFFSLLIGSAGVYLLYYGLPDIYHHVLGLHKWHTHISMPAELAVYLGEFQWQPLIIGVVAGFVVKKFFDTPASDLQLFFEDRTIVKTMTSSRHIEAGLTPSQCLLLGEPAFPRPPAYRERYARLRTRVLNATYVPVDHGVFETRLMLTVACFLAALAPFGAWVVLYYGPRH
jgi:hypothetical protein